MTASIVLLGMRAIDVLLIATGVLLLLLERVPSLRRVRSAVLRPYFAADVACLITGYIALARAGMLYVAGASSGLHGTGAASVASLHPPLWATVSMSVVLLDLGNYVAHLLLHRHEALWELHKVHHSSPVLDWLATFRSHILEQVVRRLLAPALLVVVGMPFDAIAVAGAVFLAWATLNHSNLKVDLRILEPILITPRLHHLHHVPARSNTNFGTVFSLWDRLLGRLDTRDAAPGEALGVPGEVGSYPQGFWNQLREPVRRIAASSGRAREVG